MRYQFIYTTAYIYIYTNNKSNDVCIFITKVMSLNKEIVDQDVKLDRADKQNAKVLRKYRTDIGMTGTSEEEVCALL